jgi:transcriptional regulator with XRE-family HTH domain
MPFLDLAAIFGDNLARERRLADLSQDELGVRASVHRTEVSQLERGLRLPRLDTIVKLSGSLEVSPERLFEGIEWQPGDLRHGGFRSPLSATSNPRAKVG